MDLHALTVAQNSPAFSDAQIVLVLSKSKAAYGFTRVETATAPIIPTRHLGLRPYLKAAPDFTRTTYDAEVPRVVRPARPAILMLAGWMHVLARGSST